MKFLLPLPLPLALTLTLTLVLQATITITPVQAVDNGVGRTPAMGWNSWNHFQCGVNEVIVRETVNALVTSGLRDVGYTYVNIDDCWQAPNRSDSGEISPDPVLFPSGFYSLSKYIHSYGLKFGIYSDAGPITCDGRPGSRGYEYVDAQTYAKWEVDYLKYDNCYADASDWIIDRYTSMGQALNATGRPILFSMCEWGVRDPWNWAPMIGNSWRVDNDIQDTWDSLLRCLDNTQGLSKYAKPGAFNDPDMLEVGNGGMKIHEYQAHFALWCLLKSPLLIGADVRNISADALAILKAKEVIALNQDSLGIAGDRVAKEGPHEVWAAPMFDGSRGVVLFNRHTDATQYPVHELTVQFTDIGYKANTTCVVRDLYLRHDLGIFVGSYTGPVYVHGVLALRITPINEEDRIAYHDWRPWH